VVIGIWSRNQVLLLNLEAIDELLLLDHRSGAVKTVSKTMSAKLS
jgi:hypothetical protein